MKTYTALSIVFWLARTTPAASQKSCDFNETEAELDDFVLTCPALSQIYDGPYQISELSQAVEQACSDKECGMYPFQCTEASEYHSVFCQNETDTAAAITIGETFECLLLEEEACNKKAYCNYTEVLGAFACVPLLGEENILGVIRQTCAQDSEQVKNTFADLAEKKGEDRDLAALNAAFALDFYCGKDENNQYYFPDNCPCEFGEFSKLHTYSNLVADGFGKAPLMCANDATAQRMKRAFSVNTAAVAEWRLRLAMQSNRNCQTSTGTGENNCAREAQAQAKAMKYKKSALATLNGMCVTDPTKTGPEAFCMHRLKTLTPDVKKCLMPLVMGSKTSTCTDECDTLLAPVIETLTSSCCAGTLQEYFSFHGTQDKPFLYALGACNTTSAYISDVTLGSSNTCPDNEYNMTDLEHFCLPIEWGKIESLQEPLKVALEEETARSMGLVPNQVELLLSETDYCKFDSGASAVTAEAFFQSDENISEEVDLALVASRTAVRVVLEEHGCPDCVVNEAIQYADTTHDVSSAFTSLAFVTLTFLVAATIPSVYL